MRNEFDCVDYEKIEDIAFIFLNRPERLNAVVPQLIEDFVSALEQAERDQVKAVILSGRGRAFCSGHDLKANESKKETENEKRVRIQKIQDITRKIRQAPYPVIASVHGYALGAGCEFALCCDLIIAEKEAEFGFPEVSVGLSVTGGISHIMPNAIGLVKSKELLFLGERFKAAYAKELGLINFVVDKEELDQATMDLALKLCRLPEASLSRAKMVLNVGSQMNIENAYEMEVEHVLATTKSKDAEEAAKRFLSKN